MAIRMNKKNKEEKKSISNDYELLSNDTHHQASCTSCSTVEAVRCGNDVWATEMWQNK